MTMTKRVLTTSLVWFLVITLIPFAFPGTVVAKDKADKKEQQCMRATMGTGAVTAACSAAVVSAKPVCGTAVFTASFDFGAMGALCAVVLGTAALSCGVKIPLIMKTVKDCLF